MLIEDEKLARIATIGYAKPETLNEVEWARFGNFMFLQFNAWEFFYYQNIDRQIPKELWIGADHCYKDLIEKSPGWPRSGRSGIVLRRALPLLRHAGVCEPSGIRRGRGLTPRSAG
jgi:hypothetical protein